MNKQFQKLRRDVLAAAQTTGHVVGNLRRTPSGAAAAVCKCCGTAHVGSAPRGFTLSFATPCRK
jgi:hypothetical protein